MKYLTANNLHQIYKWIAYSSIVVSLIFILMPIENSLFHERLGTVVGLNISFHLFYYLISIVPIRQLNWVKDNSTVHKIAFKMMMAMSYFIPVSCILASATIIKDSILNQDFLKLTILLVISGVILGALQLNLKLKDWK